MDSPCYKEKGTLIGGLNDNDIRDKLKLDISDDEIEEACYYEVCPIINRFQPEILKSNAMNS